MSSCSRPIMIMVALCFVVFILGSISQAFAQNTAIESFNKAKKHMVST
jgi:hypothetical protein